MVLMGLAFYVSCLAIWCPLWQLIYPTASESLMFMSAPEATRQLMESKCKQFMFDFEASYLNFGLQRFLRSQSGHGRWKKRLISSHRSSVVFNYTDQSIDDCMPVIRTPWWRFKMVKLFCILLVAVSATIGLLVVFGCKDIYRRIEQNSIIWTEMQRHTEHANCRLWHVNEHNHHQLKYFNLSQIDTSWSLYQSVEHHVTMFFPGFSGVMLAYIFYITYSELSCWLAELQAYLLTCLVCCQFRLDRRDWSRQLEFNSLRSDEFNVAKMKFDFSKQVDSLGGVILVKRLDDQTITINSEAGDASLARRVSHRLATLSQSLGCRLESNTNADRGHLYGLHERDKNDDMNVQTLEKVYIQFRLFLDYVAHLSPCMTLFTAIVYSLTYGLVLVSVHYSGQVRVLTIEAIILIAIGSTFANNFVAVAANFHANVSIVPFGSFDSLVT